MGCAASPCFSFLAAKAESGTGPMGQSEATPLNEEVDKPSFTALNDNQAPAESGEGETNGAAGLTTSDVHPCTAEPDGMLLAGLESALEPEVQEAQGGLAGSAAPSEHSDTFLLTGPEVVVEPAASVAPKLLHFEQPARFLDLSENAVANIADVSSSTLAAIVQSEEEKPAAEKSENETLAAERAQADKVAAEKIAEERMAAEKAQAEREASEKAAAEKAVAENAAAEKAAAEKQAAEKAEAERAAAAMAEAERAEAERVEAERAEAAKAAAEKAEEERVRAKKIQAEREAAEKAAAEKALAEQRAAEEAEAEKIAAARAEAERAAAAKVAAEKAEEERVRADKAQADREAAERAAAERAAAHKAMEEKQAAEDAEVVRIAGARAAAEKAAAEKAAEEMVTAEEVRVERDSAEKSVVQKAAVVKTSEERVAAETSQVEGKTAEAAAEADHIKAERAAVAKAAAEKASVSDLFGSSRSSMPLHEPLAAGADDDDIDLARLCSAFTSLEQSRSSVGTPSFSSSAQPRADETQTPHWSLPGAPYSGTASCSSSLRAHSDDVATPHWSLPGAPYAGHALSASYSGVGNSSSSQAPTTPPIASATSSRAMSDSTTPMLERGLSGGSTLNSLGNWSQSPSGSTAHTVTTPSKRGGAITPVDFSGQSEVVAGRMRDAQRMDAWFQRSLNKRVSAGALSPTVQRAMPATPTAATAMDGPPLQIPLDMEQENPTSDATFNLEVQLSGDVLGTLSFCHKDSINAACESFVTEKRLRPIFLPPLVAHAELMLHMDKRADSVDAVDLI